MIVFYNPHVDDFLGEPPHFRLLKRRALKKYGHLLQGELRENGKIRVVVDATVSAFIPPRFFSVLPAPLRRGIAALEFWWWKKINDLNGKVIRESAPGVAGSVLFAFSYKNAVGDFAVRRKIFSSYTATVFHLSHYFILTGEKAKNLSTLPNVWLAGDSDISGNPYFRHFFDWYTRKFLVIPFVVAERFQSSTPFEERKPECVATGSFHDLNEEMPIEHYADYRTFFGLSTYHPVRKDIFDKRETLAGTISCHVSPYRPKARGSRLKRWLAHVTVSQKAYFAINIVDLYNQYRYAVVGEEASGFPALGAFEAMACGCVLIAPPAFYAGYGMHAGVHFLPHDGTAESIATAVAVANADDAGTSRIAAQAYQYVDNNARAESAFQEFRYAIAQVGHTTGKGGAL